MPCLRRDYSSVIFHHRFSYFLFLFHSMNDCVRNTEKNFFSSTIAKPQLFYFVFHSMFCTHNFAYFVWFCIFFFLILFFIVHPLFLTHIFNSCANLYLVCFSLAFCYTSPIFIMYICWSNDKLSKMKEKICFKPLNILNIQENCCGTHSNYAKNVCWCSKGVFFSFFPSMPYSYAHIHLSLNYYYNNNGGKE